MALSKVAASFAETLPDMLKATKKGVDPKRTANVAGAGASMREVDALARAVEASVREALGIELEREVETFAA